MGLVLAEPSSPKAPMRMPAPITSHLAINAPVSNGPIDAEDDRHRQRQHADQHTGPPTTEHSGQQTRQDEHRQGTSRSVGEDGIGDRQHRQGRRSGDQRPAVIPLEAAPRHPSILAESGREQVPIGAPARLIAHYSRDRSIDARRRLSADRRLDRAGGASGR